MWIMECKVYFMLRETESENEDENENEYYLGFRLAFHCRSEVN